MLSDQVMQLLTAFVDGELSQRQRKAVMRLLEKSSEAREILKQLQLNAHKLKTLPRHKVEPSLVAEVVQAIAEQKAQPKPPVVPRRRRRSWLPYAAAVMAASLMIVAIGLIYWNSIGELDNGSRADGNQAKNVEPEKRPLEKPLEVKPEPPPRKPINPLLAKITEGSFRNFSVTTVPEKPFSAAFADLKKNGKAAGQLVDELNRAKAVQLDVTVKKNSDAIARLENVLKNHGVALVTDPGARKPTDNKKSEYLVYAENLTTDEVAKLMNELGDSYVIGLNNTQRTMATPFQKATLTPLEPDAKLKVAKLLGVDPATMERKDTPPEAKGKRVVVMLPSTATGQPSAEVRQFVNQRGSAQPGAIQILIRIRQE
jgi:hypothetical protein